MNWKEVTQLNRTLLFCFVYSAIALMISFAAELIWNLMPCKLCVLQRFPLFAIAPISMFGLSQENKWISIEIVRFSFLILACLAGYHFLIQIGLISDPCKIQQSIKTMDEFKLLLDNSALSCKASSFKLFGMPASFFNTLFAMLFVILLPFNQSKKE